METFTMSRKEVPRAGLVKAALAGKITNQEGARALRLTVRQFKRLKARFRRGGLRGLVHSTQPPRAGLGPTTVSAWSSPSAIRTYQRDEWSSTMGRGSSHTGPLSRSPRGSMQLRDLRRSRATSRETTPARFL